MRYPLNVHRFPVQVGRMELLKRHPQLQPPPAPPPRPSSSASGASTVQVRPLLCTFTPGLSLGLTLGRSHWAVHRANHTGL